MKNIVILLLLFLGINSNINAQWAASLEYSFDMREHPYGGYNLFTQNYLFCGVGLPAMYHSVNDTYNSTNTFSLSYKHRRWQIGLGVLHQRRDIEIYAAGVLSEETTNTVNFPYFDEHYRTYYAPLPSEKIKDGSIYHQNQRYLGLTPSVQFYWINRPRFKSFIEGALIFSEKFSRSNELDVIPTADALFSYSGGFGFHHRLGSALSVQYGGKWQHDWTDFYLASSIERKLNYLRPFVRMNYLININ